MPSTTSPIAIVGAGIAGLACARALQAAGRTVVVFEKSRAPGGRVCTRRTEHGRFNHGAQHFRRRGDAFARLLATWVPEGVVQPWRGRVLTLDETGQARAPGQGAPAPALREVPLVMRDGMRSLGERLATGLDVRTGLRVTALARDAAGWTLHDEAGGAHAGFGAVVLALPAPQATTLCAGGPAAASPVMEALHPVQYAPCWTLMLVFEGEAAPDAPAAVTVSGGPIGWAALESSRPGEAPGRRWLVQADTDWSVRNLERSADEVAEDLLQAFLALGLEPADARPVHAATHRWRYAFAMPVVLPGLRPQSVWDADLGLGACGDSLVPSRIEAVYDSGVDLAGRVLRGG